MRRVDSSILNNSLTLPLVKPRLAQDDDNIEEEKYLAIDGKASKETDVTVEDILEMRTGNANDVKCFDG